MTMRGELAEMSLVDLIQVNCTERNQACLTVRHRGREARLFFEGGDIVHAELGPNQGADVLYHLLTLNQGSFELEKGRQAPRRSIHESWNGLLLEGMRRIDLARFSRRKETGSRTAGAGQPAPESDSGPSAPKTPPDAEAPANPSQEKAWRLRELQGIAGAVLTSGEGVLLAHDVDGDASAEGAIASFLASGATALGRAMALGGFRYARVRVGGKARLILRSGSLTAGLLADGATENPRWYEEARAVVETKP